MVHIAAFYKFTHFDDISALRAPLRACAQAAGVRGMVLLAPEGINGTIAGSRDGLNEVLRHIQSLPGCADLEWKESQATQMPFGKLKVRLKREIVTMGQPSVDPTAAVGTYVAPHEWNALISDPDTVVIDTRNSYETAIGTFEGAIDPQTNSFGEFPQWWAENAEHFAGKRIAMFCTGGIRCEKSTNYLLSQGVNDVVHLRGGILKYLEEVPEKESTWHGECFVFDQRVAVGHGLQPGKARMCHGCRRALMPEDLNRPEYEPGVACHHCAATLTQTQRTRFRERQKQMQLAKQRGSTHMGEESK